jgi:hypothetical protein
MCTTRAVSDHQEVLASLGAPPSTRLAATAHMGETKPNQAAAYTYRHYLDTILAVVALLDMDEAVGAPLIIIR